MATLSLAGRGLGDGDVRELCSWARESLPRRLGQAASAGERPRPSRQALHLDLSQNKISDQGLEALVGCFAADELRGVRLRSLKLHKNHLGPAAAAPIARLFRSLGARPPGEWRCLEELHLSHNSLGESAVHAVLDAVASAGSGTSRPLYPLQCVGEGRQPLWIRVEYNHLKDRRQEEFIKEVQPRLATIRRREGWLPEDADVPQLCLAWYGDVKGCNTRCCIQQQGDWGPIAHITCFFNKDGGARSGGQAPPRSAASGGAARPPSGGAGGAFRGARPSAGSRLSIGEDGDGRRTFYSHGVGPAAEPAGPGHGPIGGGAPGPVGAGGGGGGGREPAPGRSEVLQAKIEAESLRPAVEKAVAKALARWSGRGSGGGLPASVGACGARAADSFRTPAPPPPTALPTGLFGAGGASLPCLPAECQPPPPPQPPPPHEAGPLDRPSVVLSSVSIGCWYARKVLQDESRVSWDGLRSAVNYCRSRGVFACAVVPQSKKWLPVPEDLSKHTVVAPPGRSAPEFLMLRLAQEFGCPFVDNVQHLQGVPKDMYDWYIGHREERKIEFLFDPSGKFVATQPLRPPRLRQGAAAAPAADAAGAGGVVMV